MGSIGMPEIIVILIIALVIFGAKRIPELGSSLGKAIRSFNKGLKADEDPKDADLTDQDDHDEAKK